MEILKIKCKLNILPLCFQNQQFSYSLHFLKVTLKKTYGTDKKKKITATTVTH